MAGKARAGKVGEGVGLASRRSDRLVKRHVWRCPLLFERQRDNRGNNGSAVGAAKPDGASKTDCLRMKRSRTTEPAACNECGMRASISSPLVPRKGSMPEARKASLVHTAYSLSKGFHF